MNNESINDIDADLMQLQLRRHVIGYAVFSLHCMSLLKINENVFSSHIVIFILHQELYNETYSLTKAYLC